MFGAPVQCSLLGFQHRHRNARQQEVDGDATAHGASTNDAHACNHAWLGVCRDALDLGRFALGQEQMAQRLRLAAQVQLAKESGLRLHAVLKGLCEAGLHCFYTLQGRRVVFGHGADAVAHEHEEGVGLGMAYLQVTDAPKRTLLGYHLVGEGNGACQQVAFDKCIKQRCCLEQLCGHSLARNNHVQGRLHANDAGQTLGATCAWQQANLHFWQGQLGARCCHTEVATQHQLQPTTHAGATHGGNDGLGGGLHDVDDIQEIGLGTDCRRSKLAHIGATREQLL